MLLYFSLLNVSLAQEESVDVDSTEDVRTESNHGAAVGVGLLGVTASYIYAVNDKLAVSARYHMLPAPEATKTSEQIGAEIGPYQDTTSLGGVSLIAHYHPLKEKMKWARVAVGAVYNMSTISISKTGEVPVGESGTVTDLSSDPLEATVGFNPVLPYFALGTGIDNDKGFGFFLDLGMMYQGNASVSFSPNSIVSDDDVTFEQTTLETFYNGQARIYPVLDLGVTYMF